MTSEEMLLPCPFCGGEAERFTIADDEPPNAGGDVICCKKCQASSHVEFGRKENLVSRWNSRTTADAETIEGAYREGWQEGYATGDAGGSYRAVENDWLGSDAKARGGFHAK